MKEIIDNILNSFNTKLSGYSGRKLSAFIIIILIILSHIKWFNDGNLNQLEMILTIDFGFVISMFGMTSFSANKKNKEEEKKSE